jgi:hypothetical protein
MKVAIQVKADDRFHNINFFQAHEGFKELGYEIERFEWYSPEQTFYTPNKDTVIVGGIPVIDWAYDTLGVKNPNLDDYPVELNKYLGREQCLTTIGNIRRNIQKDLDENKINHYFVKPLAKNRKKFTGHVVSRFVDLIKTSGLDESEPVWMSTAVDFLSEYRVFVHNKKIVSMKHYKGDFMTFPDPNVIQDMVNGYTEAPVAYALDVGVRFVQPSAKDPFAPCEETLLVEVNDANALGCYGLGPVTYAKMIADRWHEVMNNGNKS